MKTNNLKLKQVLEYWDIAKKKLRIQYHIDQFGREQGEYKFWYYNRQIGRIINYKDGKLHGKLQDWLSNGRRGFIVTNHFKKNLHGTKIYFDLEQYENK